MATKEEKIELDGEVIEAFPNGLFKIQLENGHETLGYTAGKMRRFRIRVYGDKVKMSVDERGGRHATGRTKAEQRVRAQSRLHRRRRGR